MDEGTERGAGRGCRSARNLDAEHSDPHLLSRVGRPRVQASIVSGIWPVAGVAAVACITTVRRPVAARPARRRSAVAVARWRVRSTYTRKRKSGKRRRRRWNHETKMARPDAGKSGMEAAAVVLWGRGENVRFAGPGDRRPPSSTRGLFASSCRGEGLRLRGS